MLLEIEVKREIVRQLLSTSNLDFNKIKDLTNAAEILTDFILGMNQTEEPCDA